MSSYIPNKPTPRPWQTDVRFPGGREHSRMGAVSSGSSRNINRGYLAGNEANALAGLTNMLSTNASRFVYYKAAMQHIDKDFEGLKHPEGGTPGPSLGEPNVARGPDGKQLAIGSGPFVMGPAPQHKPGVGPHRSTVDDDARTNPLQGPAWVPPRAPLALGPGPSRRAPLALEAGPRVHKVSAQGPRRPLDQEAPDLFQGPGPSKVSLRGLPDAPAAPLKGRRSPAGMDPRRRGTWLNYQ